MIATVNIAIKLHHSGVTTFTGKDTNTWLLANPIGQGRIEKLDIIIPHILFQPFIENST